MIELPPAFHTVVVTLHPAHAMRGLPQLKPSIMQTMARAARWANADEGPTRAFEYLNLDPTPGQVEEYVKGAREISIDIETPYTNAKQIDLVGMSVAEHSAICFKPTPEFWPIVMRVLADPAITKIGHNFTGFDLHSFAANGAPTLGFLWDTIQAESLIRPPFKESSKRRWLALSTCLVWHFDGQAFHKDPEDVATQAYFRAAYPAVPDWLHPRLYCAVDTERTYALRRSQETVLKQEGMYSLFTKIISNAASILCVLEERGMKVDEARRAKLIQKVEGDKIRLGESVREFAQRFHDKRLGSLQSEAESAAALVAHEIQNHPLFTGAGDGGESVCRPCGKHLDYVGLTKRAKCEGCARVYRAAGSLRRKVKDLRGRATKVKQRIKALGPSFKETSNDHWRWLLFDKEALALKPLEITTEGGKPSVKEEVIEALQRLYPTLPILKDRVELQGSLHTLNNLKVPTDAEGRAHFAFSLHRAAGRVASGEEEDEDNKKHESAAGNIQNKKELERQIFCAPRPGWCLGEGDWKQIELAVSAWRACDYDLLNAIRGGSDIHSLNAAAIFGCPVDQARTYLVPFEGQMRPARHAAKRATHGWDYGMGARKTGRMFQPFGLAPLDEVICFLTEEWRTKRIGISHNSIAKLFRAGEETKLRDAANAVKAQEWINAYFGKWKGLAQWQLDTVARVERDGYLVNAFGRKLRFYNYEYKNGKRIAKDREEILAYLPQTDVSDMGKVCLPPMDGAYAKCGGRLLMFQHDAYNGELPLSEWGAWIDASRPILEREWPELGFVSGFGYFRCPVDYSFGWNWGKKHIHGEPKCNPNTCDIPENPDGLEGWQPSTSAASATSPAGPCAAS